MENNKFTVINEKGKEETYEVLFTFDSDETEKHYIVYTDNSKDKNGNVKVFASIYEVKGEDQTELLPIETEKEWKVIETVLESIQEENKKKDEKDN